MFSDNLFQAALVISLIFHGIILLQNPNFNLIPKGDKTEKLEISYVNNAKQKIEIERSRKSQNPKQEPFFKIPQVITASKKTPPPFIDKQELFNKINVKNISSQASFIKPALAKPDIIAVKKKITLPAVNINKSANPSYMSYYQLVREKIRRAAYQNYTRTEMGEVYLSFSVSNDGYMREIRIVEEKSSPNPYLKETALKSVKDASPFPNFPKELDYPQLSFNVIVSFEVE